MRFFTCFFVLILFLFTACGGSTTHQEREATYVQDGDTINPLEGTGEGTTGQKYMEHANNADSTQEIQQNLID